jgi:hypothetical protein
MEKAEGKFEIIFEKIAEALRDLDVSEAPVAGVTPEELDEIDELRRIVMEVADPPATSYTLT